MKEGCEQDVRKGNVPPNVSLVRSSIPAKLRKREQFTKNIRSNPIPQSCSSYMREIAYVVVYPNQTLTNQDCPSLHAGITHQEIAAPLKCSPLSLSKDTSVLMPHRLSLIHHCSLPCAKSALLNLGVTTPLEVK